MAGGNRKVGGAQLGHVKGGNVRAGNQKSATMGYPVCRGGVGMEAGPGKF